MWWWCKGTSLTLDFVYKQSRKFFRKFEESRARDFEFLSNPILKFQLSLPTPGSLSLPKAPIIYVKKKYFNCIFDFSLVTIHTVYSDTPSHRTVTERCWYQDIILLMEF